MTMVLQQTRSDIPPQSVSDRHRKDSGGNGYGDSRRAY
jgi:hypothetical protein